MEKIDFTRFIERYLDNKMQSSEKLWFEKELEGNILLQKELELRRKTNEIVSNLGAVDIRSKLMEAEARYKNEGRVEKTIKRIPVNYAAIFLGLIVISSVFLFTGNKFDLGTYTNNAIDSYSINTSNRSNSPTSPSELLPGIELYKQQKFDEAKQSFLSVQQDTEGSIQANYLSALSNMQTAEYKEALRYFIKVIQHNDNMFIEESKFYLALCYYNIKEEDKAKVILEGIMNSESRYRKEAKKLLRKIR